MIEAGKKIRLPDHISQEIPQGLQVVIDHARRETATGSMWMGAWCPIYRGDPSLTVPYLHRVFSHIREQIPQSGVVPFFDFGAGPGIVGATAAFAGFWGINIEIQPKMAEKAKKLEVALTESGVLTDGNLETLHGSYYTKEAWEGVRKLYPGVFKDPVMSLFQLSIFAKDRVQTLRAQPREEQTGVAIKLVAETLEEMTLQTDILQRSGWQDNRGKLPQGSVVYAYLSDPFCEIGRILPKQLNMILPSGSFIILGETSHLHNLQRSGDLDIFQFIGKYESPDDVKVESLFLFQKI